jgi:hypothetical protein
MSLDEMYAEDDRLQREMQRIAKERAALAELIEAAQQELDRKRTEAFAKKKDI